MTTRNVLSEKTGSCFAICPIGSDGGETRRRSDKLLKYVIKPVLDAEGYSVERADQLSQPGMITNQVVRKILDCDILVADLSEGNPNVFYELAIRHGARKPFVHMIDAKEKIPFDNAQVRTIPIDLGDLDSVDKAKAELLSQVRAIRQNPEAVESPLTFAMDIEALKSSSNADEQVIAAIYREITQLRREVLSTQRKEPHSGHITDEASLLEALRDHGFFALADQIETIVSIDEISWGNIDFSSPLAYAEDEKIASSLRAALAKITGKDWQVDHIPF